ncbi:MAG: amino acid adenylation domain-containing protein, partial [Pseudomonadota bacterium]
DFEGLFFHHLRYFGVHMYEGRPGFLTTTHETEHYEKMFQGFMQAADAMHKGGFLPLLPSDVLEFPLTDAQAEVAVAAQLSPEASAAFNEQLILKFDCHFDAEVLQIAWQKLTQRHQSLRARLNSAIDALEILPWVKAQCVVENINLNNQETVQHRLTKHVADVFDLKTAPIVRLLCLQDINALQNKQTSMLCLCVSHLMCDGWSMEVIMRELAVLYSSILEGRYPDLPIAPTLDQLVSADSEWRNSEDFPLAKEYWLNTFKPLPKSVDWPSDFVRPSNKSFSGKRLRVEIPENLALKARQYACEHHCTLFVVLLTAYNLFLHRLTHADDLVIGVPAAGQPMMGLEDLVCHDVHFMPLRFRLDPKQTASEWVQYVKNQFSTSKEHQAFTFGAIIQALNLPRDRSKLPLISAAFNLDLAMQGLCYAGHTGEFVPTPRQFVKYDLFFNAQDEHESLWLEVDFNTSIFAESTVHHWVDLFNDGLQQLLTATGPLNKLTPVSIPQEKPTEISANSNLLNQIEKLNKLENPIQKVVTLSDIFQRQAEVNPQRTAIFLPEENAGITYAEVWKRAQQVAVYLQRQGVKPKDWVGLVFADNHDKALIGMLAILILGAAYVPIPLAAPKARRSLILEDAQVSILLIADPIAENISDNDAAFNIISIEKVLSTDTTLDALPFQPDDADAIAYVIYTSGTTGKPKGVPITHKQVSRLLDTAWPWFDFGREDRWSLSHSIAFDFSVWEIWGAWKNGAAVSLVPKQGAADPETFTNFINQQKISVLNLTPLALYSLTEYWLQQSVTPKSLRWIILGGDVFDIHRIEGWWAKSSSPRLVNMYGITEITVHATYCEFTRDSVKKPALGPSISGSQVLANRYHGSCVGQPLPDLKIYVLDDKKQPVPVGVVGEIYVAGAGVGSGYHKRTELTATKFLPDLNNKKNTMYRSGDLARQTADGQLWFMGRCDNQVQIRGYRIELSDVESAVNKIPAIREAVVIALPDQVGDLQLVAFYAVKNPITPADLRRSAIELLPTYMVPTEWVAVTTIPRTVNGKVDSKQLEHSRNNVNTVVNIGVLSSELDSANPVEQVVKIWTDVLHRPVSAEDDFFAVGGHSLLAIKILHRVENEFGIRLHLGDVFDHPTALGMAGFIKARLQNALKEKEITPKIPEQKVAPHAATNFQIDRRPVASIQKELLSAFQLRMLFADLATRTSNILSAFNVPYVLHFTGDIHWDALQQALHDVWQRHPILGVRVYTENRQWWQTQNVRSPMVLQWDNSSINSIQDGLNGSAAKPFIFDVKGQPSDSLVRLQMWRVSDQEVYGVWNLHHLIVDSWSMSQLWHDIAFAYDARQQNEAPVWSDTALDYFAWIKEQAHVNTQVSSAWKNLAADFSLKKLTWNSEPLVSMVPQDPGYFSFQLNTNQIARLDSWCKQRHLTRFLGLFAVFAETVHRVSKVQDFVIAVPMLCRDDARWANTLGLFLNTVPVPMHCDSAQPLAERLAKFDKVWKTVLSVSELPGDELLRGLLGSDASGNLSPWLTTLFSYQVDESSDTEHVLKLGNANVSLKEWKNPASKYPLSFYLQDEGQHIDATFEYHIEVGKIKVQQIATLFLHVLAEWTEDPTPVDRFDKPDALDNVLPFHSAISSVSAIASSAVEKNVTPIDEKNAVPEKIEKLIAAVEPLLIETPADVANVEELISVPDPLQTLIELSRKKPHQHSVISGESRLTRQIMMEEVASIVSSLQQQGLKTGDAIGVMMERDTHQVALLIACWNLGLTYVPLDSKFPNQRLQKMIAVIPQGVLKVVVSNEIQAKRVETLETLKAVNTPKSESILIQTLIHSESIYEIKPLPIADSVLAYLMFTSGSTGQPKAVQISRANVKVFLEALSHSLQLLNENNRFAAITRIGFDIHVLELWWPLISGAELHWMPDAINQDPMQLVQYIRAKKITHMQATPSLWGRICRAGLQTGDLQTALTGGEALPTDIAQSLLDRVTNVVNLYGPTEATVWATIQHLKTAEEASIIGQTMSHVSAQIADKKRQFLTGEAEGELILVGAGVARGYLGADDEAQKAFFQIIENEKSIAAYATGDRVRRLPDNRLQFLGRLDQQIKIRGQRVELLDIEAHLRKLGLDAAVLADTQSSPIIVAFVTTPWNKKEIKKTLAEQLPEHMLPTRWVSVEGLPLNANGKVDRSFLMTLWLSGSFADVDEDENPEFSENASTSSFATPYAEAVAQANNPERDVPVIELDPTVKNSELSQLIRGLWKELLAIKSIEDDNDFFALG